MRHTKKWHLERVTGAQQAVQRAAKAMPAGSIGDVGRAAYSQGRLTEALIQAGAAGASIEELKAARAAA